MQPGPLHNETELLRKVAQGDETAFTQLFHHYHFKIYNAAFTVLQTEHLAEELVQDVFLKIWLKRETLVNVEHFTAYLFTAARNHAYSALRRLAITGTEATGDALEWVADNSTDETILGNNYRAILQQAIEGLPPRQKQAYQLSKEQGLKREEVAKLMGIAPQTVKIHLGDAMRYIRAYYIANTEIPVLIFLLLFGS